MPPVGYHHHIPPFLLWLVHILKRVRVDLLGLDALVYTTFRLCEGRKGREEEEEEEEGEREGRGKKRRGKEGRKI